MSQAQPVGRAPSDIPPEVLEVLATARATADVASRATAAAEALLQVWSSRPEPAGPSADTIVHLAAPTVDEATKAQAATEVERLVARGDTLGIDTTDTALGTEQARDEPDPGR